MVDGAILFECTVAELPGVVVYGVTETAARTDMNYELSRFFALASRQLDPTGALPVKRRESNFF